MSQYSQSCLGCYFPSKRKFHFFPFCFKNKIEKNKRENREGCWEWSHVTDVGKNADFSPHHWFFSVDELLFMFVMMIKTHLILPFSLFSLSLFVLFQVITVGAGRHVHHGNCWCKYTLLHSNSNEKKAVRQARHHHIQCGRLGLYSLSNANHRDTHWQVQPLFILQT